MRTLVAGLVVTAVPAGLAAQGQVVDHERVRRFASEVVTVEGPVARVTPGPGGALWFSLGKPHPSSSVVIVVPAEFTSALGDPQRYEGRVIRATGRIQTGEAGGIGIDPTNGGRGTTPRLVGRPPRSPYLVLSDASQLWLVSPAQPDTAATPRP